MPKNHRNKRRGSAKNAADSIAINLARASGANTELVRSDLSSRRQNFNLVQSPPRNFLTNIYWTRQTIVQPVAFSTSTSVVAENNFAFTLSALDNASTYTAVFDQYCIYSVTATFAIASTTTSVLPVTLYSAIDYDNVANIGLPALSAFSTFNEAVLVPQISSVRMIKPCVALAAYNGAFTGYTTTRSWLDANSPTIQHYGLRTICAINNTSTPISAEFSLIVGFRNSHG